MPTLFTRIIEGELPGTFVWQDDICVAFLSINPLRPGHTLVVPRAEIDHWVDADPALSAHLYEVARTIGRALDVAYSPVKVGLMIAGLEVPHLHIHVVPIWTVHDLDFANAARTVDAADLEEAALKIVSALSAAGVDPGVG